MVSLLFRHHGLHAGHLGDFDILDGRSQLVVLLLGVLPGRERVDDAALLVLLPDIANHPRFHPPFLDAEESTSSASGSSFPRQLKIVNSLGRGDARHPFVKLNFGRHRDDS